WALPGGVWGMGGTAGDVNGDGAPDLVITEWGRNRLFLNDGGGGLSPAPADLPGDAWSSSCAFLDYNADGHLDLVVVNYLEFDPKTARGPGDGCQWKGHDVMCGPEGMTPTRDQLLRGRGDGTFEDVTETAGWMSTPAAFGLGVMTLDYDRDGDTDVYVANDSMPNHLWQNDGDGTFTEIGLRRGVSHDRNGAEQAGMGIACGDVNGDGRDDLFVTNFSGERNVLYRSSVKNRFREKADALRLGGPSLTRLGWGTGLWDYNLDGWLDVSVVNGHVYPAADLAGTDTPYAQVDQLFLGTAKGPFREEILASGPAAVSRASVTADFDEDGDLDIVVIHLDGPVQYLENQAMASDQESSGGWLSVDLKARRSHPDAIGARVEVTARGRNWSSEVRTTAGFQAGSPRRLHFGLGGVEEVDAITVLWPSGHRTQLKSPEINCRHEIVEPVR
ncbi:MAG: CRTAC1 family protein, partial [Planctomycetota bacterium]